MDEQATELRYAVRFRVLFKYFGQLCLVLAALTLLPFAMSVFFGNPSLTLRYGLVIGGLGGIGAALARLQAPSGMQANEGLVVVALMFLFTPLVMTYPMMGAGISFQDALFEAVSGVTTTGLTTVETLNGTSPAFLFLRAWMQWYGGLGIAVFSLALLMQPGLVAKALDVTEKEADDLVGGTRAHARRVLQVYTGLTLLGILGCLVLRMKAIDAVLYTFAAVSTGGFAPHSTSIAGAGWPAQVWISLLCLAGAIPLTIYYRMVKEKRILAVEDVQIKVMLTAILVVAVAAGAIMRLGSGIAWKQIVHHAPLLALSAQTTAGFSSMSCARLDAGAKLVLIFAMLVGGGAGSTAGGLKVLRLLIAAGIFRLILVRSCLPKHAIVEPRLAGRRLQNEEIHSALLLIVLFVMVVALSWLPFVASGYEPLDSLFEVVSATGTVGLSVGLTSASLPTFLKGILCFDMLMGRLEIIAWLVLFYPVTWFGRRMEGT